MLPTHLKSRRTNLAKVTALCFLAIIFLLLNTGCAPPNEVDNRPPAALDSLATDAPLLPPSLTLAATTTAAGGTAPTAWQAGQPVPGFEPQARPRVDLAGSWRKERVDLDPDITLANRAGTGLAALEDEADGRHRPDYDDSAWEEKTLPGVENILTATGPEKYEGGVWYRRAFTVPAAWAGQHVTFNSLSVNYVADIWLNGQWIGYHEGGYTPFALSVTPALRYGEENTMAIRVDNPPWGSRNDIVPGITPDWWNYTGVIHDLYLEAAPPLYLARVDVRVPDTTGRVQAHALLHNAGNRAQSGELSLQIHAADREAEGWLTDPYAGAIRGAAVGEPATMSVRLAPGEALWVMIDGLQIPEPQLWSPGQPNLYVMEAALNAGDTSDTFMTQFGVRTIERDGFQLRLNGEPYFLAGIARHEEWPDSGRSAEWDKILADLTLIQSLNANFVRTAHYPNHFYTYLLTDRLGLLAGVEIPVWQYDAAAFDQQAERQIADQMWREMILAGSNRPSIILWSMHNESQDIPERAAYVERLAADYYQNLRDGRLLTQSAAADRGGPADATQALVDVAGWTMYFSIFYGSRDAYPDTVAFLEQAHAAFPDTPLLNTEYGIWSQGGGSSIYRQEDIFEATFPAFLTATSWDETGALNPDGYLAGITWWAAFDWFTAHTYRQTMGLYQMDRATAKPVAELLQEAYAPWRP